MIFADMFLSARNINVPELNFKRPLVTTQCHLCPDNCLASSSSKKGGKINIRFPPIFSI